VLHPLTHILGTTVMAPDGEAGTLRDVYVDVGRWRVEALVLDLAVPQAARPVLVPASAVRHVDLGRQHLDVTLATQEILDAPRVDPYEGPSEGSSWPPSWYSPSAGWPQPRTLGDVVLAEGEGDDGPRARAPRAASELFGFRVRGADGEIGHLVDLVIEDGSWRVPCLIVDTGSPETAADTVALPASLVRRIDDEGHSLLIDLSGGEAAASGADYCAAA
jgi:hypothetical protein